MDDEWLCSRMWVSQRTSFVGQDGACSLREIHELLVATRRETCTQIASHRKLSLLHFLFECDWAQFEWLLVCVKRLFAVGFNRTPP